MSEYNEIAITNRRLCKGDFLTQLDWVASQKPWAVLLREKDLPKGAYCKLARQANAVCLAHGVPLITHTFPVRGVKKLHVPFALPDAARVLRPPFSVAVHAPDEAKKAVAMGASFVIAGHVFATGCKPGLPPRGLDWLRGICAAAEVPVFAVGGITPQNAPLCLQAGAAGICRMSYWMEHNP
ncbi:MAG: thiamine phosphate synthase [Oscillospiraceae bacterium]|jgi:thiamine-phosphate pyrophosphorylase|nr:thiamine phosphate synthase [Oscillospiraceae bacterium]